MPNIKIQKNRFHTLMKREFTFQQLEDLGFEFGIEIQQSTTLQSNTQQETHYYSFDCTNNRPDLLCEASLTRTLLMYLEKIQCPTLKVLPPIQQIIVQPSVNQIRPFVVGAVLRNITFTPQTYKAFIDFQQKLHVTFCRKRTYVSMGTHDLDSVQGPFRYVARDPKSFKFLALNQSQVYDGPQLFTALEGHKLKQYLPIIRDSPVYPLILDNRNEVCSLPPIINSEYSKISVSTKNVFIQITATSKPKANICLNTLVWGFAQYCQQKFTVQAVQIIYQDHKEVTPVWNDKLFVIHHQNAVKLIGSPISSENVIKYLARMGFSATIGQNNTYNVNVPAWRSDVIHECDILEDIAICFGYQNVVPLLPPSQTIGSQQRLNKLSDMLRSQLAYAQYNEALNFALCSKLEMTKLINNDDESKLITISNAKTKYFQTGRTTLISGLLKTAVENKANSLPFKLFEVGDVIIKGDSQTGTINQRKIAALITDQVSNNKVKGLFSHMHGLLDLLLRKLNIQKNGYSLKESKNETFFPSQQAEVYLGTEKVGIIGILHPRVILNFKWQHPVAAFELDLEILQKRYFKE